MKVKKLNLFLYSALILTFGNTAGLAAEKPPLFLKLGEQRLLSLPPLDRYSVSGTAIRYTRLPLQNQLLIKAVAKGFSTFLITHNGETTTQSIRVESIPDTIYPKAFLQALNMLESTETIDGGSHMILRGEVKNPKEALAIAHLKRNFFTFIIDETHISPIWFEQNKSQITEALKSYPQLSLDSRENMILIQGAVPNQTTAQAIQKKIRAIQPLAEFEIQTFQGFSPTLYFKVFLLEVQKEFTSHLGTEITQPFPLQSIFSQSLSASIHALSERGMVRVLSAPELVVKSPGQAELFAGGEMPIRLRSRISDNVIWKNIGLALKLDVKEYNGENVRLTIETEMNHQNKAMSIDEIPSIKTNRIKTTVEGKMGRPLLLSGLLQEDTRDKIRGIYGISEIPIIGKLFGSEDFQKNRSELVAVLLPQREPPKEPMQRISSDIPKGFLPLPRNHISAHAVEQLQSNREYPWNVL